MKRSANITAIIACALWGGMFLLGRDLVFGIYTHGVGVFPNAGQIDFGMNLPLSIALTIAICAWLINAVQRWFALLGVVSAVAVMALFPFLLVYGGGV